MNRTLIFSLLLILAGMAPAQRRWYIYLTDPGISEEQVRQIREEVRRCRFELRWLNAVTVEASRRQIRRVEKLPFVSGTEPMTGAWKSARTHSTEPEKNQKLDTLLSLYEEQVHLNALRDSGISGKGVRIAIFDAGFRDANTHPALAHMQQQIVGSRDFFRQDPQVFGHSRHGTQVLACMAGRYGDRWLGFAQDAEFLLARTEHGLTEKIVEEDAWIAALEWADSLGADIVSASLSYTRKRYTYADMDGKTTPVSRAAATAWSRGILIINSMGNEGDDPWRYMGAPADVTEVLSVGASYPMVARVLPFSSVGPTADGRPKPDISAPGYVVGPGKKGRFQVISGTSFSTPLVAGLAACALQQRPGIKPDSLHRLMRQLGHFYPYYDYELGCGVADARKLLARQATMPEASFRLEADGDSVWVVFSREMMAGDTTDWPHGHQLSVHLETSPGVLASAFTTSIPHGASRYLILRTSGQQGTLRVWFEGWLREEQLE